MRFYILSNSTKQVCCLQNCDQNHRNHVTNLTNRKTCDSAHEPGLDQLDKFEQRNRIKVNESQSENYNVKINKKHNIFIYVRTRIRSGLRR